MDKERPKGGGFLGDRLDDRAEVTSLNEFRERARAVGFSETEIEEIAKRYGCGNDANADGQEPKAEQAGFSK
ncbi:MAG: hypothetical protein ACE360_06220 [Hyphomicrobiales bacterium]